ncbi:Hypothetical predicted protein [Olea europaea subsp. europaea]|uniref:Prenyltransferase alpha-alpha toroid domain-containing protein n=1 Tax=Olea europaea subsp. europaea TaxID=158383 RepID=A0A8S0TVE8_OLEEU|nr:Hypothetical predicted protein [Olea europaea subsp. europaea]
MEEYDPIWNDAPDSPSNSLSFDRARHIRFLEMMYQLLPSPYQSQEINRFTLAYFVIAGLDILAALDRVAIPNGSHLASTYCALSILKTVGYDISLDDSKSLLRSMRNLQQPDGSVMPIHIGAEMDLQSVFCAGLQNKFPGLAPIESTAELTGSQKFSSGLEEF